ncbi:asparagine synthase-related protein [Streptacidiphilus sp. EB129]|uniref:asparagine synthase-related protein n=1 Tax=Streptacidiphilus sp. EB129 TaxID=3156262 RepID=UPI0035166212
MARTASDLVVRGRRDAASWLGRHAALIQRTDQAWHGSARPTVAEENGRTVAAAVCDGYLKNAAELCAAVGGGTAGGDRPSPAEPILRGHLRWGSALAEHLDGAFAFAIWDERSGELVLGRDRMGIKPLSYFQTADGVLFASDLAVLAVHPLMTPELDADGVCAVITKMRETGRSGLRGVSEVPSASLVRVTADKVVPHWYWALEAREHDLDEEATIARAEELLRDSVSRDITGQDPGVLLSGGLDPSVPTALVATGNNRRPVTFTVAFEQTAAKTPDRPFIEDVVGFWDCDHQDILVSVPEVCDPVTISEVLAAKDHTSPFGDKNVTPYLLARRAAERVPVVVCGEAADTMSGGLYGELDSLQELSTFPWLEQARRFGVPYGTGAGLFSGELLCAVDADAHLDRVFRAALAEVPTLATDTRTRRAVRQLDYLTAGRLQEQTMLHAERLGTAAGVQMRFPFADHTLYSFMYSVPPEMKFVGGRTKSQLREFAKDLVPQPVLNRVKSTYPATYDARYKDRAGAFVATLLKAMAADCHELLWTIAEDPGAPLIKVLVQSGTAGSATRTAVDSQRVNAAAVAAMVEVWQEVLRIDVISPEDSFFELGGRSLLAESLVGVERRFGREVPLRALFDWPRLIDFTEQVLGHRS